MTYEEIVQKIIALQKCNTLIAPELEDIKTYLEEQEKTLDSLCITINAITYESFL